MLVVFKMIFGALTIWSWGQQSNFAQVEELGEAVRVTSIEGSIPDEFPEGVYIRNGMLIATIFARKPDNLWTVKIYICWIGLCTYSLESYACSYC